MLTDPDPNGSDQKAKTDVENYDKYDQKATLS